MGAKKEIKVGIYQCYEGNKYQVLFVADDRASKQPTVVYKSIKEDKYYTRSVKEFLSEVEVDKKKKPRFTFVEPNQPDSWEERCKRALADYQNLLKQTAQDKQSFYKYAIEGFLHEILPVYDNLKVAVKGLKNGEESSPWVEGVKYVIKQFQTALAAQGIEEIKTLGEKFDPECMEAISDDKQKDSKKEMICEQEVKPGYRLSGKVIIPAKVIVK